MRRIIMLIKRLIGQMDEIPSRYGTSLLYAQDYLKWLSIIRKVLVLEKEMLEGRKVSDHIVSIDCFMYVPL